MLSHFDILIFARCKLSSLTKLCVVALIKEYFSTDFLDYNIPRVRRSCTAHQGCQDRIRCKYIYIILTLCQFPADK